MSRFDVCIAGGGIVGLALAALLGRQSLQVAIIEPAALQSKASSPPGEGEYALRVSAINLASMHLFAHLGIADGIIETRASAYRAMQVWDANSSARIAFDAADIDQDHLGYIIENDLVISKLYDLCKSMPEIELYNDSLVRIERDDDGVDIHLNGTTLRAGLLVGADGQHSMVRQLAGIPTDIGRFHQTALVCRIGTQRPHRQTAYQCFHHSGPIAYLPLADGSCSIVWSCDSDRVPALLRLSHDEFAQQVETAMQSALGSVELLSPRAGFDLAQQHAQRYLDSRIALVGDAAHRTHPLAGLGANLGLQDAAVLAEVIEDAVGEHRSISSLAVLRRYERLRRHQNAVILDAMQAFKTGFGSDSPLLTTLRALAFRAADNTPPLKQLIVRLATGLSGDLPRVCAATRPPT